MSKIIVDDPSGDGWMEVSVDYSGMSLSAVREEAERWAKIVEVCQLHQIRVELETRHLTVAHRQAAGAVDSRQRAQRGCDLSR